MPKAPSWHGPALDKALQVLECYLQVTDQRFAPSDVITEGELDLLVHFVATFKSGRLLKLDTSDSAYQYLMPMFSALYGVFGDPMLMDIARNARRGLGIKVEQSATELAASSNDLELNLDVIDMWAGWPVKSQSGRVSAMDLYSLHTRLGAAFARAYCKAVNDEYSTSRSTYTSNIYGRFANYLANDSEPQLLQRLSNSYFSQKLIVSFMRDYFIDRHTDGVSIRYLKSSWRNFVRFLEGHIFPSGLIAAPEVPLPIPIASATDGRKTRIRKSLQPGREDEVKANLITEVPLNLTDVEAAEVIFKQLESDLEVIRSWALSAKDEIVRLQNWRRDLASRHLSKDFLDEDTFLARTAYQYEKFVESGNPPRRAAGYCREHPQRLGIVSGLALLPFAILITIEHPNITKVFLDDLELYDKNGNLTGLAHLDGGSYLTGYKMRRGAIHAEQRVKLNSTSLELVEDVISLTTPLREIANLNGGAHGRRLFLAHRSKTIRSLPSAVGFASIASFNTPGIARDIARRTGVDASRAERLAKLLSVRSVRATMAVLHLRDTGSLEQTAEAIGHKAPLPKLMDYYVPEPLHDFLRMRWIRIFQTGIIIEAMRESPLLLEASGLSDLGQLDEFLNNHALNIPTGKPSIDPSGAKNDSEALVCISPEVVRVLSSIESRVEANRPESPGILIAWAAFYAKLKSVVLGMKDRPDLIEILCKNDPELGRE